MTEPSRLPSWRPGATRDTLLGFLDAAVSLPVEARVAYFDNDGTLWCERPNYIQFEFFLSVLGRRAREDASLAEKPELAALMANDKERISEIGLERIAMALVGLFEGQTPEEFRDLVREFMSSAVHEGLGRPMPTVIYQPMLELIAELRQLDFTVGIATGGGTEFVRAVSSELYDVPPELVVGSLIKYAFAPDSAGNPTLRRTAGILGDANEGPAKVTNIQTQLGRRPILAAGNSSGDSEMLEWAAASGEPSLALLVAHDDAEREYAYESVSGTLADTEPITKTAAARGWCVVSMADDWSTVFAD